MTGQQLIDYYTNLGYTDIHGGPPQGSFWRGINPATGKVEQLSETPETDADMFTYCALHGSGELVVHFEVAERLEKARDELAAELERERMRNVACGVVAMADTPESAVQARDMHPDYQSASCNDVARRVDECITLRSEVKWWQQQFNLLAKALEAVLDCIDETRGANATDAVFNAREVLAKHKEELG